MVKITSVGLEEGKKSLDRHLKIEFHHYLVLPV